MPKVPTAVLKSTFYLYPSAEDAAAGTSLGGTGFIIGIPSKVQGGAVYLFAVSNWHVVCRRGCSVVRLNRLDGSIEVFDLQPDQWEFVQGGYDVALAPMRLDPAIHDFAYINGDIFIMETDVERLEIGPGENVFMAGRFIDHDGAETNKPALRFGHVSMMPEPIRQLNGDRQLTYCLDIHSRPGFSGSPVFAFRTPGEDLSKLGSIDITPSGKLFFGLLGIHWGQFPEYWTVVSGVTVPDEEARDSAHDGQAVKGLSGMCCASPAWAISDTINRTKLKNFIEMNERFLEMQQVIGGLPPLPVDG